ncbi:MAG: Eco57I restriction-modification methylase domain-containing protein [Nitrospirae bacterium]|nr:Eco57I restriction-modification methylase domain-containing protein [Nitrospirota bacterium]
MTPQASFALRGRNPDVLTCIANLSNDEVFTPPEFANRMLDTLAGAWAANNNGANLWADKTVKFLDPCTKSGVFLREITSRLTKGLQQEIPNLERRVNHILTKQVFGIGITQITSLLARRSVYCSKHANGKHSIAKSLNSDDGNIWFKRIKHTWDGDKCKFCGANRRDYDRGPGLESHAYAFIHTNNIKARLAEIFGGNMQFDVIIGNPPYQLGQSGGEAVGSFAMPIYQKFVQAAKSLDPRYAVFVTPSRWFAGGRGLDDYRSEMLNSHQIRVLVDFPNAADVCPGIDIAGGVSYFLWDRSHKGPSKVQTIAPGVPPEPAIRHLNAYDIFVRYNTGVSILEKVWPEGVKKQNLGAHVSPIQPFSLRTAFRGKENPRGLKKPIKLWTSEGFTFIERSDVPRNDDWIDQWKVILGRAYGERGSFPYWITSDPIILEPGTACTETYLVINRFNSKKKAKLFAAYLRTRLVRFLISLRKNTQDLFSERFSFVPDLPMDRQWTDKMLYKKYCIAKNEIAFINAMIRPMDESDE